MSPSLINDATIQVESLKITDLPQIDLEKASREELIEHIRELTKTCTHLQNMLKSTIPQTQSVHEGKKSPVLGVRGTRRKAKVEYNRNVTLDDQGVFNVALESFEKFPLFKEATVEIRKKLAGCLMQITRSRDSFIIKKGEVGAEMFFIYRGTVSIMNDKGDIISTLNQDSFFGELGLLFQEKRTASVKVTTDTCTLLLLTKKSMDRVLEMYPEEASRVRGIAKDRNAWFQRLRYISDTKGDQFGGEFIADVARTDFRKILLFENAEEEFLHLISLKVIPEMYADGKLIVKKDDDANEMYLILNGAVEVISDDLKTVFAVMNQGSFFGEVGILLQTKRTANVRAKGPTTLLKLTRGDLQEVISKYPVIEGELKKAAAERYALFQKRETPTNEIVFELNMQNLMKVSMFSNCERTVLDAIASTMQMKKFKGGEFIISCGDKANEMYFLTQGNAEIVSEFNDVIAQSPAGTYFGEVGILHNLPRIASVRAKSECVTYLLKREDLIQCLEKYPDLLKELKDEAVSRLQNYLMRNVLA